MVTIDERRRQLASLVESLRSLVSILRADDSCQWRNHFETQLSNAEHLLTSGFTQEQLAELSSSICFVFGGMGSFGDYSPDRYDATTGRCSPLPGTQDFENVSGAVQERASELRIVGRR